MNDRVEYDAESLGVVCYLQPISEQSPAGVDARLEPEHELLRAEVAKLSGIEGAAPDWALIESLGGGLLTDKSKDLLVATYVACALTRSAGLRGAAQGAWLLTTLLATFGSAVFPQRARARAFALEWYLKWLGAHVEGLTATSPDEPRRLGEQLHRLRAAAQALLGDDTPSFVPMLRHTERIERAASSARALAPTRTPPGLPESEAEDSVAPREGREGMTTVVPVVTAQRTVEHSTPASHQRSLGPPPTALSELQTYVARTGSLLVNLARSRFLADRTDARVYRWLRAGVWLRWEHAPTAGRRGRAALDGPSALRHAELTKARDEERWDDLLRLSELQLVRHPLWLDLNRFSDLALERLGEPFALARAHVLRETRALVARLPELTTLAFSDGTPFAGTETLKWLAPPMQAALVRPACDAQHGSLHGRLQSQQAAAVAEVESRPYKRSSLRDSFLHRLELASALEQNGQPQRAAYLYLGLERDIDTHQLERWEPELALRALHPLWKLVCAREGAAASEVERLSVRLSQLSPTLLL